MDVILILYLLSSGGQPVIEFKSVDKYYDSIEECEDAARGVKERMGLLFSQQTKDNSAGVSHRCKYR
jgi:hypothetical protein